jgi:hypothetical protein
MATRSFYQTLTGPLSPRLEAAVRRVAGAAQAILACLLGTFAVRLFVEFNGEMVEGRARGVGVSDAGGAAFAAIVYGLIPATVLLAFGAVSVWRNRAVKWWLPLLVMVGIGGTVIVILR